MNHRTVQSPIIYIEVIFGGFFYKRNMRLGVMWSISVTFFKQNKVNPRDTQKMYKTINSFMTETGYYHISDHFNLEMLF